MENNTPKKSIPVILVVVVVIVIIAVWFGGSYNGFVTKRENINNQWAQVENQLQRRFDLIPNLVETVKGVAKQEKDVFGMISEARTHYGGAKTVDEKAKAAGEYESAIGRLLVIAENYPILQSSQSFRDLMTALEGSENRIAVERMKYNDAVKAYDISRKSFPSNIIASLFHFEEKQYFQVPEEAKATPKVNFTN